MNSKITDNKNIFHSFRAFDFISKITISKCKILLRILHLLMMILEIKSKALKLWKMFLFSVILLFIIRLRFRNKSIIIRKLHNCLLSPVCCEVFNISTYSQYVILLSLLLTTSFVYKQQAARVKSLLHHLEEVWKF